MKIRINLHPGGSKKKRGGGGLKMPDFAGLASQVKDPLLLGAVGSWILGAVFIGGVWSMTNAKTASLTPALEEWRRQGRNFEQMIAEKDRMRVLRDSLGIELAAIRGIDGDRFVWPHIMDEISRAMPEFTWIVSLDAVVQQDIIRDDGTVVAAPTKFSVDGRTSNIQAYTRFMTQLGDSPWLSDIQTGGTSTVVEGNRNVTSFRIEGTFRRADSAFIQTMPITSMTVGGG